MSLLKDIQFQVKVCFLVLGKDLRLVKDHWYLTLIQFTWFSINMPYHCVYVCGWVFALIHEWGMGIG